MIVLCKLESMVKINFATNHIVEIFTKCFWIVKVKYNFVIFNFFLNFWIALLGIVDNDNISLRCFIDLDPDLEHTPIIDNHNEFLE